jgi:O-antigen/teichoic acid export membrane protein
MTAERLTREYLAQIIGFTAALVDRLFIAGLMVRFWGSDTFGAWALAMAAGSMVGLFDFGFGTYFGNRVLVAVQTGDTERAIQLQRAGNLFSLVSAIVAVILVGIGWQLFHQPVGGIDSGTTLLWITLLIAITTAARQAIVVQSSIYRAYEQFSRVTWFVAISDLARIAALVIALFLGAGPLEAGLVFMIAMIILSVIPMLVDLQRRFPHMPFRPGSLPSEDRRDMIITSGQYWVQSGVNTLITYAPTLLLGIVGSAAVAIAQFTLMRTLANFSRQVLILFSNVFGLEVSRRLAVNDREGAIMVFRESTRLLAVQTAAATGAVAALGSQLFALWTGSDALFDPKLLWLALVPPVIIPSLSIASQVMITSNWPKPLVAGRMAQLVLSIALFFLLPISGDAMRLMAALAIGEVVGLGLTLTIAASRKLPGTGLALHADVGIRSAVALAVTYGSGMIGARIDGLAGLIIGGALAGITMAIVVFGMGLSSARKQQAVSAVKARFSSAA